MLTAQRSNHPAWLYIQLISKILFEGQ